LGVEFSMMLHGSDLLLHGTYLDAKLENCAFCLTVSEYNRRYILQRHPNVGTEKVIVVRLGVEVSKDVTLEVSGTRTNGDPFTILTVGRLHAVKDHAFLVRACAQLRDRGVQFECLIAGDGPERRNLEFLICQSGMEGRIGL
jgi:glycosyltransferase involved in cell wall biosynthesis